MVCVLGATVSVVVWWSHASPLLRVLTRYIAGKPAIESVGGAAQARISGPRRALKGRGHHLSDPGARKRAYAGEVRVGATVATPVRTQASGQEHPPSTQAQAQSRQRPARTDSKCHQSAVAVHEDDAWQTCDNAPKPCHMVEVLLKARQSLAY